MPRKYDRDNKGTPLSRTSAPAVRGELATDPLTSPPSLSCAGKPLRSSSRRGPSPFYRFPGENPLSRLDFALNSPWISFVRSRGRDGHLLAPAQNRTGGFPAYGSRLGWLTAGLAVGRTRSRPCDALFRPCVRSVRSCPRSRWPPPFAQKAPPPVARPCSPASPPLRRGPTSHARASCALALKPSACGPGRRMPYAAVRRYAIGWREKRASETAAPMCRYHSRRAKTDCCSSVTMPRNSATMAPIGAEAAFGLSRWATAV